MKYTIFFFIYFTYVWRICAQTPDELFLQQGIDYAKDGSYKKAMKCYNKAIAYNAELAEAYYQRGQLHYEAHHYQAVIDDNKEAIRLKPAFKDAYFNLGISHYRLAEFNQSIQNFTTLLTLYPQDAEALYWRGLAYFDLKKLKEACADWQLAQKLGHGTVNAVIHKHCESENAVQTGD